MKSSITALFLATFLSIGIINAQSTITLPAACADCPTSASSAFTGQCKSVAETAIVEITSPGTGRVWMDRELGASRPTSETRPSDPGTWGCLYQWGRKDDGHELVMYFGSTTGSAVAVNSSTAVLSTTDDPGHNKFIKTSATPNDWRTPTSGATADFWDGINAPNNPCPTGFYVPSNIELDNDRSWLVPGSAGYREETGIFTLTGSYSNVWSSTPTSPYNTALMLVNGNFLHSPSSSNHKNKAWGATVRCIKQ